MLIGGCADTIEQLEERVRNRLADSLSSVWRQTEPRISTDSAARSSLLENIRRHTQHPCIFARYYDLTLALLDGRIGRAQQISDGLLSHSFGRSDFAVRPFSRDELGEDFERLSRLLFAEYSMKRPMAAPDMALFDGMCGLLSEAYDLIAATNPNTAHEIKVLWPRIYLARPDEVTEVRFAGVTSFMAWGATFMNAEAFDTPWKVVEFLVHESTHSILFALGCDEPLVTNPIEQCFKSPLRSDPRPMDGIYHATLVCARIMDFNRRGLDMDIIPSGDKNYVERSMPSVLESYRAGSRIIREHGILSKQAEALLDHCDQTLSTAV